jgi:hypothetical protein
VTEQALAELAPVIASRLRERGDAVPADGSPVHEPPWRGRRDSALVRDMLATYQAQQV